MQRHFPEDVVVGQEIVDAQRLEALERGLGRPKMMIALDPFDGLLQARDQIRRSRAFDHGISVVPNAFGVRLNDGVRQHSTSLTTLSGALCGTITATCRSWEGASQLAWRV